MSLFMDLFNQIAALEGYVRNKTGESTPSGLPRERYEFREVAFIYCRSFLGLYYIRNRAYFASEVYPRFTELKEQLEDKALDESTDLEWLSQQITEFRDGIQTLSEHMGRYRYENAFQHSDDWIRDCLNRFLERPTVRIGAAFVSLDHDIEEMSSVERIYWLARCKIMFNDVHDAIDFDAKKVEAWLSELAPMHQLRHEVDVGPLEARVQRIQDRYERLLIAQRAAEAERSEGEEIEEAFEPEQEASEEPEVSFWHFFLECFKFIQQAAAWIAHVILSCLDALMAGMHREEHLREVPSPR